MKKISVNIFRLTTLSVFLVLTSCHPVIQPDEYYYYLLAGEPTANSVILQARLQKTDTLVSHDLQGIEGQVMFRITRDTDSKLIMESPFFNVSGDNDFIAKHLFIGLRPGTKYFYQVRYGKDSLNTTCSRWNSFRTLESPSSDRDISFVVVTGMNYWAFQNGNPRDKVIPASSSELKAGFPAFRSILYFRPDIWISTGDNVYYDRPADTPATSLGEMRKHWHRLFSMRDFGKLLEKVPAYWMIDDHDYRFDDCDTLETDGDGNSLLPGNALAIKVFREEVPVIAKNSERKLTYRTYRLNRDVQVWMLEGRLYRSPNSMPDQPGKSIWGKEQLAWLKTSLKESNSPFKLIISPTPLVGPDDASKTDNHTNFNGFRAEKDSLFLWLKNNGFRNNGLYFICGDRHWQYHSIDPSGFEEFSCGALVDANARIGRLPGDSLSTDPDAKIVQPYCQEKASGGFLLVNSGRDEYNSPVLLFRFYDDQRELLYAVKKF